MVKADSNKIKETLFRGVESIYPGFEALEKRLKSGQRIRLYCGYDPTGPTLHLGHAITLRKLAQFQALGHEVIMLVGDFTGMIGDPTDKTAARKRLTRKEVLKNAKNYKKLASKILKFFGPNPAKIKYNSRWNDKLSFVDLIELSANFTVGQMLNRDMFQERIKQNKPIYLHEFLYPLAQAYDSLALDVDLEIGGKDQTFNMLRGRDLMQTIKGKEKFVLAMKLLTDSSGKKMGKTEGKMVCLDASAKEMYGQIMSWPDSLIISGLELLTDVSMEEVEQIKRRIQAGGFNPREAKTRLAREIVAVYYNQKAALQAEKEFNLVFKERKPPSKVTSYNLEVSRINALDLLVQTKLTLSKAEAKRLVEQDGVKIDGQVIKDWQTEIQVKDGMIVQVGRRRFIKLEIKSRA